MTSRQLAALTALGLLLGAVACSEKTKGQQEAGKPPVAVDTAQAAAADFQESIEVVGTLAAKSDAAVKSEYTGVVTDVYVTEWVPVKKGQPLARLDDREHRASLLQVKAEASRAQREYERALKLKEVGLITQQGLEDAETQRDAAKAMLDLAQTKLDKSLVRSPIDGVVAMRGVSVGDRVESMGGDPMFRIVDNRVLDLKVTVPSGKISAVKVGQPLTFTTEAVPGRTFEGKVAYINPSADEASRAIGLVAEVPNTDGALRSGLFVRGKILTGNRAGILQIPRVALLTWDLESNKADCFVVQGEKAFRRSVSTGSVEGDAVEVISGLTSGDLVVTRGGFNLSDGDRVVVEGKMRDARR
jgi:membrane fusion protein, multidrug efflux system